MRRAYILLLVALAIAAILAFAASQLRHERARLLEDFAASQQQLSAQIAEDLHNELREIDEDARLVGNLAQRTSVGGPLHDPITSAVIRSSFEALAAVVRPYRLVALFAADAPSAVAPDPSEQPDAVRDFLAWSAEGAGRARQSRAAVLEGPRDTGGRQFYVYAVPLEGDRVIVLVWEARLFLQLILRPRPAHVRYFVLDPSRAMWIGCGNPAQCRGLSHPEWSAVQGLRSFNEHLGADAGSAWGADAMAASLGLPQRSAVVAWHRIVGPDRRSWILGSVGSAVALESREQSLLERLLIVSVALMVFLGGIAAMIVRHFKRTAILQQWLRNAQEVAHLRERSEKLVENVPVGLLGITREGTVALVNRFLQDRFGRISIGAPLQDAFPENARGAASKLARAFRETMDSAHPRARRGEELLVPGPKPGHFEVRVIPLQQAAEDVSALVLIEDFSELKSLEHQLIRAEKFVTIGVLTAGLAHEVGSPLAIIRVRAESLLERVTDPAAHRDLESVIAQIDHIAATIRQVLDFSRTQAVELRPLDAEQAVATAVSLLDWRFRQKAIRVSIETERHLRQLAADPDQFQQVLVNLLMNAVDACPEGASIIVRLTNENAPSRRVSIEVVDTGCGIPQEHINAVFDPFFTTKKRGEGTGLGLPVVASIVRNHHAEIALTSDAAVGTTVLVLWPSIADKEQRNE